MKNAALSLGLLLCIAGTRAVGAEPSPALDLPATRIFSKGPNVYAGEVLEITKGRGAIIGWYVQAKQSEEVRVSIEKVSRSTISYRHVIMRGDTLVADGRMTTVHVDKKPGEALKSAPIPDSVVDALRSAAV